MRSALILMVLASLSWFAHGKESDVWCDQLAARLRSVQADACRAQPFAAAPVRTVKGHHLMLRDIAPTEGGDKSRVPARILVVGGIHGDELTSVSTVFRWLAWIDQGDASNYRWRVIPLANPDGLMAKRPTRVNGNGIDLNRNFITPDWDKDARAYWVNRTRSDPRRFPGQRAGSEIETRWLQAQIESFRPDLIISVHAPYNLLDYDGPVPQPLRFGRLSLNRLGVYPGSMGNYAGLVRQIPVITIELPHATMMPAPLEQRVLWEDLLAWAGQNIRPADSEQRRGVESR